jgi:hypothetical protein
MAMKKLIGVLVVVLLATSVFSVTYAAAANDVDAVQKAIYKTLLLNSNQRDSRLAATCIRKFYPADEELTDLVAEKLAVLSTSAPVPRAIRTVNTYVDVLANNKSGRYRSVLRDIKSRINDNALIKHINEALASSGATTDTAFVQGKIDLVQQRALAASILSQDIRTDRSQFKQITQGTRLDDVLQLLGMPDLIHSRGHRIQLLELNYKNAGLVVLGVTNSGKPVWVVNYSEPEWMPLNEFYDDNNFDVAQNLIGLDGRTLAMYYKTESRRINSDSRMVCLYLRRIVRQSRRPDPYELKMAKNALHHVTLTAHPCAADTLQLVLRSGYDDLTLLAKKSLTQREQWIAQGKPLKDYGLKVDGKDKEEDSNDMDDQSDEEEQESSK